MVYDKYTILHDDDDAWWSDLIIIIISKVSKQYHDYYPLSVLFLYHMVL